MQRIHEVGIEPHLRAVLAPGEEQRIFSQRRQSERTERTPDPQLERAIDALRSVLLQRRVASS
jgi:hypothetical protein